MHRALVKELESLHAIIATQKTASIHGFYNRLSRIVRTLKTLRKLDAAQSMVYTLLDKLGPVREIIARGDNKWEEWDLEQLAENLRKYVDRNLLKTDGENRADSASREQPCEKDKLLCGNGHSSRKYCDRCVYCGSNQHNSSNCTQVLSIAGRREILKKNKLCYNCTGAGQSTCNCRSQSCTNVDRSTIPLYVTSDCHQCQIN